MEEEIIKVVDLKILFDDVEFHSLREQSLPVPAAVQVKGMKFEHISLRSSLFSKWYVEQLIKKQANNAWCNSILEEEMVQTKTLIYYITSNIYNYNTEVRI